MTWVLVFLVFNGPVITIHFEEKQACVEAGKQLKKDLGLLETRTGFSCLRTEE